MTDNAKISKTETESHERARQRDQEGAKEDAKKGDLAKFLEQNGFSAAEAEYITESLHMYYLSHLYHVSIADINEVLLNLPDDGKSRLMNLVANSQDAIKQQDVIKARFQDKVNAMKKRLGGTATCNPYTV
jgi:hypothetical protein